MTTYIHQDSLGSTSLMTDSSGAQVGTTMKYYPFGAVISGSVPTTKEFTGQRLDGTGLYYYNARYYDATIGRFISADSMGIKLDDPQSFNRYSYCLNNPLKYTDPTGQDANDDNLSTLIDKFGLERDKDKAIIDSLRAILPYLDAEMMDILMNQVIDISFNAQRTGDNNATTYQDGANIEPGITMIFSGKSTIYINPNVSGDRLTIYLLHELMHARDNNNYYNAVASGDTTAAKFWGDN